MFEDLGTNRKVVLTVGLGLLSAAAVYKMYAKLRQPRELIIKNSKDLVKSWKPVGKVTSLQIFPVKSCKGNLVDEAEADHMGLALGNLRDRSFMVVNTNNNFLHARIHPHMVLIGVSVGDGKVELTAPDTEPISFPIPTQSAEKKTVRVWGDEVSALDCGEGPALWLSQFILKQDSGARLVHVPYTAKSQRILKPKSGHPWRTPNDGAIFSDESPFHLMSTESASDLNSRLPDGETQISTLYFRPTITISGCQPYEEDEWKFVRIGQDAVLRFVKGCDRCILTTINPVTGIKHPESEPLRTLKKYRIAKDPVLHRAIGDSPLLGVNLTLDSPGRIRVGDVVYAGQL